MNEVIVISPEELVPPPRNKWEREYRAFQRLLPELIDTHRGKYVAIHDEQVVESGDDRMEVIHRALAKVGNVSIHVGYVGVEPEPVCRSGVVRDLRAWRESL